MIDQKIQVVAAAAIIALVAAVVSIDRMSGTTDSGWDGVEQSIGAITDVSDVAYDSVDDFLVVTVGDDLSPAQANSLGCRQVLPAISKVSSVTLFAIYSESGRLLASWHGCEA